MNKIQISDHFASYFELDFATTPEQLRQAQHLRYEVYCREFKFEDEENCPGEFEQDEYDTWAIHCLVIHRSSAQVAGCVRLIPIPLDQPDYLLPLERYCGHTLHEDSKIVNLSHTLRNTLCEISRLAVDPNFRRRHGETTSPLGATNIHFTSSKEIERRTFPLIGTSLLCAVPAMALLVNRPNTLIMVENWLVRLLRQIGYPLVQIGETTDYHGLRTAYSVRAEGIVAGFKDDTRALYDFVEDSLRASAKNVDLDKYLKR